MAIKNKPASNASRAPAKFGGDTGVDADYLVEQKKLDAIQSWLARTTEPFDDWEYDGEGLAIFLNGKRIEYYSNKDINRFILREE